MRLLKISFKNYKILEDREFEFEDNPFVFTAPNETGKSTLIEGIKDAFSLSPERLKAKRTEGKEIDPVLEVTFEIGEHTYTLKVNAQDGTVRLSGSDGTDLGRAKAIEDFLERKGYHFFPAVLNGLLVLKERDLATETGKGLKSLLDTVLKSASIEEVKKLLEDILIFQKGSTQRFKSRPFGKEEKNLKEELKRTEERLTETIKRHEEYRRNKEELEKTKGELEEKIKAKTALEEELERDRRLLNYAIFKETENKIEDLKKKIEDLEKQLKEYGQKEKEKLEEKEKLKRQENEVFEKINQLNTKKLELIKAEQELKDTNQKIKFLQEIEELNRKLGKFQNKTSEELRSDLLDWETYRRLCQESKGILRVLEAKDKVEVGDQATLGPGEAYEFEGEVLIRYRDLSLQIYTSQEIEKVKKKIEKLAETYGSIESLRNLIKLLKQKESLSERLDTEKNLADLQKKAKLLSEKVEKLKNLDEEIKKGKRERESLSQSLEEVEKRREEIRKKKEEVELKKQKLEDEKQRQEEVLKSLEKEIENLTLREAREFEEECSRLDLEDLEIKIEKKEKRLEELREEIVQLEKKKSHYEGLTQKEPDKEELDDLLSQKRELEEKLRRMLNMERVLRFGLEVLVELRGEINRRYLGEFESSVSDLFSRITYGNYTGVRFETESLFFDGDTFKTKWRAIRKDGRSFPINELSDGTSSQLLLSARLALIRLFFDRKAFLLLDEPFAYFDHDRTQKTMNILHSLTKEGWQVIVMSAKE